MVVASLLLSFWHISTASLHLFPRPNRTDNYGLYRAGVYRRGPRCGHSNTNNDSSSAAAAAARRWREADEPSPMLCWRGWASQWPAVRSWSAARLRRSDSAYAAVKLSAPFGSFAKLFDDWAVFRDVHAGDATSSSILFDYAALRHPALARGFAHLRPAGAVVLSMPPPNAAATAPPLMRLTSPSSILGTNWLTPAFAQFFVWGLPPKLQAAVRQSRALQGSDALDGPPWSYIVVGPAGSGTFFHRDPMELAFYSVLVRGRKRWLVFHDDDALHAAARAVARQSAASDPSATAHSVRARWEETRAFEWFRVEYPLLLRAAAASRASGASCSAAEASCRATRAPIADAAARQLNGSAAAQLLKPWAVEYVQEAGDMLAVPPGRWHVAIALEDSMSISEQIVSASIGNAEAFVRTQLEGDKPVNAALFCHALHTAVEVRRGALALPANTRDAREETALEKREWLAIAALVGGRLCADARRDVLRRMKDLGL